MSKILPGYIYGKIISSYMKFTFNKVPDNLLCKYGNLVCYGIFCGSGVLYFPKFSKC